MAADLGNSKRAKVRIHGEELVLKGDGPAEYLHYLAMVVDEEMERLSHMYPNLVGYRLAILTAIHLADKIEKLKKENAELQRQKDAR